MNVNFKLLAVILKMKIEDAFLNLNPSMFVKFSMMLIFVSCLIVSLKRDEFSCKNEFNDV